MEKEKFISLLARKFSGGISAKESILLEASIRESESYRLLATRLEAYMDHNGKSGIDTVGLAQTWDRIATFEQGRFVDEFDYNAPKPAFLSGNLLKVAAVLVLAACVGLLAYRFLSPNSYANDVLTAGNHKVFKVMEDGTTVWLNKKSTIRYNEDFGRQKREIFLEGEAYFDVAKNTAVPLFIHAGGIDIQVKGTAFNVNAYRENGTVQVALIRGSIAVTDRQNSAQSVVLEPNDKLFFPSTAFEGEARFQILRLNPAALLKDAMWAADTLTFDKEKLRNLALKLEKKYDVKIEIQTESLKEKRFSGSFTSETLQQVLEALRLSYPLTYSIKQRLVTIKEQE
ncbi:MAG: DUF4974 domain-containing protein [Pedobacter sp.]|nr:MAG: DUF4974 domain-containing protein [Pedobacter sp.]